MAQTLLFVSLDICGSTAFKSVLVKSPNKWATTISDFFLQARTCFSSRMPDVEATFQFWKTIGDEILFSLEVRSFREIQTATKFILDRKSELGGDIFDKSQKLGMPLMIKTALWLAEISSINDESAINLHFDAKGETLTSDEEAPYKDYIGPGIDLGFRLAKLSQPRASVISIELAYSLLQESQNALIPRYLRREEIKGVLKGLPYPIMVLHEPPTSPSPLETAEENLLSAHDRRFPEEDYIAKLKYFCKVYIETAGAPLFFPFDAKAAHETISQGAETLAATQSYGESDSDAPPSIPAKEGAEEDLRRAITAKVIIEPPDDNPAETGSLVLGKISG
jgi:hypothetical protein